MTAENNPTPPPWHTRANADGHDHHIKSADNVTLAKIYAHPYDTATDPPYGTVPAPEGLANARAIVQAINTREVMLRALLLALSHLQPNPDAQQRVQTRREACDKIAEAIRAATQELP